MAVLNFGKKERSDFPRRTDSDDSASDRKDEKVDEDLSGEHVERQDPGVQQQASILASIDPAKEKRLVRKIDRWLMYVQSSSPAVSRLIRTQLSGHASLPDVVHRSR